MLPKSTKPLKSVKGVVISDYQSFLEKVWLDNLKSKYSVVVNQELLMLVKNKKINLELLHNIPIEEVNKTFDSLFAKTVQKLGASEDVYFGWNNNIYNTELKPHDEE